MDKKLEARIARLERILNRKSTKNEGLEDVYEEVGLAALDVREALRKLNGILYKNLKDGDLGVREFTVITDRMVHDINDILNMVGR